MDSINRLYEELASLFSEWGFTESAHLVHNGCLDFYRKGGNSVHWIRLSFDLDSGGFVAVRGKISFNSVTNILREFTSIKKGFIEEIVKNHYVNPQWSELMGELCSLPLKTEINKKVFKSKIMQHVDNYILPFFDKFPDLQAVNNEILNKVSEEEYTDYIPGQTNFKVLIIMKLCNNPKFEGFKNWALDAYKKGAEMNPERYGSDYNALQSLVKYLEDEQYKSSN